MHEVVVVVAGGGPVPASVLDRLPAGAPVVAADGGVDVAQALGQRVDVVVGDLDSVSVGGLEKAEAGGARVERHPAEKDATDLDLALETAASMGRELVVVGFDGGRLDHLVAGLLALATPDRPPLRAHLGRATVRVLHGPACVADKPASQMRLRAQEAPRAAACVMRESRMAVAGNLHDAGAHRGARRPAAHI